MFADAQLSSLVKRIFNDELFEYAGSERALSRMTGTMASMMGTTKKNAL